MTDGHRDGHGTAGDGTVVTPALIQLLTAIGTPAPPAGFIDQVLTAVAELFRCDAVVLLEVEPDDLMVTGSHRPGQDESTDNRPSRDAWSEASAGIGTGTGRSTDRRPAADAFTGRRSDAEAFIGRWPRGPAATEAIHTQVPVTRPVVDEADLPADQREHAGCRGAWVPLMVGTEPVWSLLVLLRRDAPAFTATDVRVLSAVALRMRTALANLQRLASVEHLAKVGPTLTRHLELQPLLDDAVLLFRDITNADSAFVVLRNEEMLELAAFTGIDISIPRRWPRTTATMPQWDLYSAGKPYVGPRETIRERPSETHASPTVLCVPVMRDDTVIALLGATGHQAQAFGTTGMDIAVIMANYLSVAMLNGELYRALVGREHELRERATHDPLTGLANRTEAGARIDEALANSASGMVGLMFCDIDKFKAVNDRLGHEAGDELIQQVALRLSSALQPGDTLARFGGDEFVFLLGAASDLTDLAEAGRRVQLSLADPVLLRGERVPVSASIGAVLGRTGTTASVMLRNADAAMYAAKGKGPGRIEVFDDAAAHRSLDRLDLRSELGHALERGELSVVYQPLVELKTGRILSFEALARWTHHERGEISPDVFIPMAEETGAIVEIGAWVLAQSCVNLRDWQHLYPRAALTMGVNISAVQLEATSRDIVTVIESTGTDPHDVWLEVTERMDTSGDISGQVDKLRSAGAHFVLDDFGMSYSSLTYLVRFPVEGIKIDRTFVQPMTDNETQRGIVRAILALGESLSVIVVAEGIETQEQVDALADLGCVYGQGYLLAPPMTPEQCVAALRTRT